MEGMNTFEKKSHDGVWCLRSWETCIPSLIQISYKKCSHIITNKLHNHLVFPSSIIIISSLENELNKWVFGLFVLDVRVLYNSDLSFSDRLYGPLDVDLCRVKLHEPLSQIIQQPLLYVRDMVPKPCFQGLLNLHQVNVIYKLGQGHWKRGFYGCIIWLSITCCKGIKNRSMANFCTFLWIKNGSNSKKN